MNSGLQLVVWAVLGWGGVACADSDPKITEKNYLKADSMLWVKYDRELESLLQQRREHPDWRDSLHGVMEELSDSYSAKNVALAIEYANVPSGLQRVYMTRNSIDKEQLSGILSQLPDSLKENEYARWIGQYVNARQLKEGDRYVEYDCRTADGEPFDWSVCRGRNLLLIYDGLGCMGEQGRNYLTDLLKKTDRKDLELIVHCKVRGLNQLKKLQSRYPQFKMVSDCQFEGSVMNIVYAAQATPTCFLIGKDGLIKVVSVGLDPQRFEEYLKLEETL